MKRALLVTLFAVLTGTRAAAADVRMLLPETGPGAVGGRVAAADYDGTTLSNFINGGAELFLEYGFVRAATADYGSGDETFSCTVYEMKDAAAAFGVFSYFRGGEKPPLEIGDAAFGADLQVAFWQDRYFTVVETFSTTARRRDTLLALAREISSRIKTHASGPAILAQLPDGRVAGSERLLRGRVAANALSTGWTCGVLALGERDVLLEARYPLAGGDVWLWLVQFADPAALERAWTPPAKTLADGSAVCRDGERVALARRLGVTLAIVRNAGSLEQATALVERVRP